MSASLPNIPEPWGAFPANLDAALSKPIESNGWAASLSCPLTRELADMGQINRGVERQTDRAILRHVSFLLAIPDSQS
jgi:hypothetical protein